MVLLLSVRILTSTDDKDDNDITEPERDEDRLFEKFVKPKKNLEKIVKSHWYFSYMLGFLHQLTIKTIMT